MRGLTLIRDPRDGHDVLLGAREQPGVIERIDLSRNHAVTLELDVRNYFSKIWYGGQLYRDVTLIAYNDMTAAVHPKTGEPIHLIGLWVLHPERRSELGASSWYLVRYRDGSYAHGRVFDPGDSTISPNSSGCHGLASWPGPACRARPQRWSRHRGPTSRIGRRRQVEVKRGGHSCMLVGPVADTSTLPPLGEVRVSAESSSL